MSSRRTSRRQASREQRQDEQRRARRQRRLKRLLPFIIGGVLVLAAGTAGFVLATRDAKVLPPTTVILNHPEIFPPQKIMTTPIEYAVQSHLMEHGAGEGSPPGVVVSYNCVKFTCEPDLVAQLTPLVESSPSGVYLAPYPTMDAKIALTTRGKVETLDTVDADRIRQFIAARPSR